MKKGQKLILVLAILIFLGTGGYLLREYLITAHEEEGLSHVQALLGASTTDEVRTVETSLPAEPAKAVVKRDEASSAELDTTDLALIVNDYLQAHPQLAGATSTNWRIEIGAAMPIATQEPDAVNAEEKQALQEKDVAEEKQALQEKDVAEEKQALQEEDVAGDTSTSVAPTLQTQMSVRVVYESLQTPDLEIADDLLALEKVIADYAASQGTFEQGDSAVFEVSVPTPTPEPEPTILPKYAALHKQNPDMVGWISVDDTEINFPVMQTIEDPEYYLLRNFDEEESRNGLPFIDSRCDISKPLSNILIYGHNINNKTMFGVLKAYEDKRYWEKHPIIRFDLLTEERRYEVFAVFRAIRPKDDNKVEFKYYDYLDFTSLSKFDEFLSLIKKYERYDTGIVPQWGDELIMLTTCSYHQSSGTFVVMARRIWD